MTPEDVKRIARLAMREIVRDIREKSNTRFEDLDRRVRVLEGVPPIRERGRDNPAQ